MKKAYAFIIIVVCIAIAIVGWNGLMKTYTAQSSYGDNGNWDTTTEEGRDNLENYLSGLDNEYGYHPENKKNPFVVPIGLLTLGVIGICYGVYSLKKSTQS